jgi:tetratricopeptide (TPR) repeat protein
MSEEKPPSRNIFDIVAARLSRGDARSSRGRLAQLFALLGTTFALLQLFFGTLDLANRSVATLQAWLPYLVPGLFIGGAVLAAYFLFSSSSRVQKQRAGGALALVLFSGSIWGGWTYYQATRPPKAVIVLVADFDGQQATRSVDWGRRIYEQVKAEVAALDLGERVEVQRVFQAYNSSEEAQAKGTERKATLVLWGWYDDVGVSPHFELLQKAKKFEESLAAPPQELTDFDVYVRSGAREMAYIVAVVLGLIQHSEGNQAAAEALFTKAVAEAPPTTSLLGLEIPYFYRANARFFGHKPASRPMDGIVADLGEAIARRPDFWQAHWNLALAYTGYCTPTLALDAALVEAEKVQELRPGDAAAYWLVGQIRARRGEWQEAAAAYRLALQSDPDHLDSQEGLAKALEELGQGEEAQRAYQRVLELRQQAMEKKPASRVPKSPEDEAEAEDKLGYAYLNTAEFEAAIAAFKEALRLQPQNADYHRHLGNAYYWQGRQDAEAPNTQLDLAIAEYEEARRLAPDDSLLLTVLGGAYQEAGRKEDALHAYEEGVTAAPCDDEALFLLASQYDALGRQAEAAAAFQHLVQLNPRQSVGWHWLATTAYMREDYRAAASAYRAAAAVEPQSADLYYGLGSSLYALGDYAGAEEAYRQAQVLAPEDAAAQAGWADSLAKLGRSAEAIAAYEKVVALEPAQPLYWLSLGLLYEGAKRLPEAASAYGKATKLNPDDAILQAALGRTLQAQGKYAEAASAYKSATQLAPEDVSYWESLALNYTAIGRLDDAMQAAEQTLERDPASAVAHLVRGGIYEDRGAKEQAQAEYRQVLGLAGSNEGAKQLAEAGLKRLGD